jgi:hypothetical protein
MMQDVHDKLIQDCHGKSSIQQGEGSFHPQLVLKYKLETSEVLHREDSFSWCYTSTFRKAYQKYLESF